MNKAVQSMVEAAIASTGVEDIINSNTEELFDDKFLKNLIH